MLDHFVHLLGGTYNMNKHFQSIFYVGHTKCETSLKLF